MNSHAAPDTPQDKAAAEPVDRYGNAIDPVVGYARGQIISSSVQEARRLRQGQRIATQRVLAQGPESISIFTGNQRDFPIQAADLAALCEEWVGPGIIADQLRAVAIAHMGGMATDAAAVFNRTSAGIIAAVAALAEHRPVVSFVPAGGRSHVSVVRGCAIAGAALKEVDDITGCLAAIQAHRPALVVITTITSSLERLPDSDIRSAVAAAQSAGAIAFLDDAYGARIRPVLHGGGLSLELGADLAITNCDKAGLSGPRAGMVVGRPGLVTRVSAKASEFGMEARAPIIVGALRSLERYTPDLLIQEARSGADLSKALAMKFGSDVVQTSDLGPMVDENDLLAMLQHRSGQPQAKPALVPAEATAAIGMILLRDHGILTTNTHGQPGARVSLRFKPTVDALPRIGGVQGVVQAMDAALAVLAKDINDPRKMAALILGEEQ